MVIFHEKQIQGFGNKGLVAKKLCDKPLSEGPSAICGLWKNLRQARHPRRHHAPSLRAAITMINSLIAVFGPPTPLSYALRQVVNATITVVLGAPAFEHVNEIEVMRSTWGAAATPEGRNIVLVSEAPQTELSDLFIRSGVKAIVAVEPFAATVAYLTMAQQLDFLSAVRCSSFYFSLVQDLARTPATLLITQQALRHDLSQIVNDICDYFGLECTAVQMGEVLSALQGNGTPVRTLHDLTVRDFPEALKTLAPGHGLSTSERALLQSCSGGYDKVLKGDLIDEVTWLPELFLNYDQGNKSLREPIEMTGPTRFLIIGPYLHLPSGAWQAEIDFEVIDNFSKNEIQIDTHEILEGKTISNHFIKLSLPANGRFKLKIQFNVDSANSLNEVRIFLIRGAIEGVIILHNVVIKRRHMHLPS